MSICRPIYPLSYLPLQGPDDNITDGYFVFSKGFENCVVKLQVPGCDATIYAYAIRQPNIEDEYIYVTDTIIGALGIKDIFTEISICAHPVSYSSASSSHCEH